MVGKFLIRAAGGWRATGKKKMVRLRGKALLKLASSDKKREL